MHKARAFFYVAAGVFLLALSYHLGARSAGAQSGAIVAADLDGGTCGRAVIDRTVYLNGIAFEAGPVPGTEPVIEVGIGSHGMPLVMLANGDVWWGGAGPGGGAGWGRTCNAVGGAPTPAQAESWGALKVRYRGERGAAQPATQDR